MLPRPLAFSVYTDRHATMNAPAAEHLANQPAWSIDRALALFEQPFFDLVWQAQAVHRIGFDPNRIQRSALFSIKTGGCSEDCKYCSQSARYGTDIPREPLKPITEVLTAAKAARAAGATRFCMGAAWRNPKEKDLDNVVEMVRGVKALGLETCLTLGMLTASQVERLKRAGLDFYNHNLDTAADYYPQIVTTHTHADRMQTIEHVRDAGIKICSGGIIGMGETRRHRAGLLVQFANMPAPPASVPINHLVAIPGTPLEALPPLDSFEFVRTVAVARILLPRAYVRLSAGRSAMSDELQALCFLAGANSIFYGDKLLTSGNTASDADDRLFSRLGLQPMN